MKKLFLISFIFLSTTTSFSQNKNFTIDEAVMSQWRELSPLNYRNVQWKGNSSNYTFQDYNNIYQQSVSNADSIILLSLRGLNQSLLIEGCDTLISLPAIIWETETEFHFNTGSSWFAYSILQKKITSRIKIPEEAENITLNYLNKIIAYTNGNNIYLIGIVNKIIPITESSDKNMVNGQTVSRNEFGITNGIFWSPKGNLLGFYRKDEHKVMEYPLVDITKHDAKLKSLKYPMAGAPSENISLGIYDLNSKKTHFIEDKDTVSEKYLTNISWDTKEQYIYIQVLNRAQNHMKLNKYKVSTGEFVKTLFEEKHPKYVEPQNPITFLLNNSEQFIYQSRRDGYNHAYLYDTTGTLIKQLTKGNFEITKLIFVGKRTIYFESTEPNPLERHFFKVDLSSGKKYKRTSAEGTHSVLFNSNESHFIDTYSNIKLPNCVDIVATNGKIIRNALTAVNPLKNYNMPELQMGTIKAADGTTDLYYRLIKPTNFDSLTKYPAIIYVYGGPHDQLVEDSWLGGARLWEYYMAQKGYILFTVDNRGSANRGLEFENVIHRQCGVTEMKDQMEGINFLNSLPFVDMGRIGVHGWSYGGFMTLSLMVNYPEIFKVGVAGGPVTDWSYYEVMYGERYMDTPAENPQGYMYTSLLERTKNLKGKALIIHGAMDNTVVWQHSQLFLNECIKNQIPIDYFVYPKAEHNVRGYDRIHLMQKVTSYFDDYLK
ncbi:MAG: DPP IV N-terminal domain-containing protein [Salinivirgaceae bacterium]